MNYSDMFQIIFLLLTHMEGTSSSLVRTHHHRHQAIVLHMGLHLEKSTHDSFYTCDCDCGLEAIEVPETVMVDTQAAQTHVSSGW